MNAQFTHSEASNLNATVQAGNDKQSPALRLTPLGNPVDFTASQSLEAANHEAEAALRAHRRQVRESSYVPREPARFRVY